MFPFVHARGGILQTETRRLSDGDPAKLLAMQGLDAAGIERVVRARFA